MNAVLLAAGKGTRLKPYTLSTPKCLVEINGKVLIDYWLDLLVSNPQINKIFINVCYLKEKVIEHINANWGKTDKITLWHEDTLLGTAGTIKQNYSELVEDEAMVIHADNLSFFDLNSFLEHHSNRPEGTALTMMLFQTDTPKQCGIVELDQNSKVIDMHEKVSDPPGSLANGAVYILSKEVIEWINTKPISDISNEVIPSFFGRINSWENKHYHRDIGTPESLSKAIAYVKSI